MATNRLYRSRNRVLGGVLAGFAKYVNFEVGLVRLIYVLISVFSAGFPGYADFSAPVGRRLEQP